MSPDRSAAAAAGEVSPVVRGFYGLRRSKLPVRVLSFDKRAGRWVDLPPAVVSAIAAAVAAGRGFAECAVGGRMNYFDLSRMVCVDAVDSAASRIGWVDAAGELFFPSPQDLLPPATTTAKYSRRDDLQEGSGESDGAVVNPPWRKAETLSAESKAYAEVEKLFSAQMPAGAAVTAIHKCRTDAARAAAFQAAARAAGNVKLAWYGGRNADVAAAVDFGFAGTNDAQLGKGSAHGAGLHLAPLSSPWRSAAMAEADGAGQRHLVLCRVVAGKAEPVEQGSRMRLPSSIEYDSGAAAGDEEEDGRPKWHVVWSPFMNTHVIPVCVVSFVSGAGAAAAAAAAPSTSSTLTKSPAGRSSNVSFPKLLEEMRRWLPPTHFRKVDSDYRCFKRGEIGKEHFIRGLRLVAGDRLLATSIKKIRGY